jgi:hypothetical protein
MMDEALWIMATISDGYKSRLDAAHEDIETMEAYERYDAAKLAYYESARPFPVAGPTGCANGRDDLPA